MRLLIKTFLLLFLLKWNLLAQGVGVGSRYDLTQKLNLGTGQFAQLFIPEYFFPPADGKFLLVFHLHSASWAAEDQVYKSNTNAVLFNIHLGSLSSPYQNYFSDQSRFNTILDTLISVLSANEIISNPQIKYLLITSFSAGYAGLREMLKTTSYYDMINSVNLADGLHCSSDPGTAAVQLQDFLRFAIDSRDKKKIMLITHSSITTSGYWSTTQTADYLLNGIGTTATPVNVIDEIGTMYARCDTGYFHMRRYLGNTADDHLKHLYAMHLMLEAAVGILDSTSTGVLEDESMPGNFFLYQNYPNPFNTSTVISCQLRVSSNLLLEIYDVLGNKIVTLVNEEKQPGTYKINFDGSNLSSAIYFYTLTAGDFKSTKKLMLLK
jgi:hypothetical protein